MDVELDGGGFECLPYCHSKMNHGSALAFIKFLRFSCPNLPGFLGPVFMLA